jgi:hypothetical protein
MVHELWPSGGSGDHYYNYLGHTMKYDDEKFYEFHEKDAPGRCFICGEDVPTLMIFRQIKSMLLVHLCRNCVYENIADYLLDNTRPWLGDKR